jgi:hypothetical protein
MACLLLSACATTAKYEAALNGWIGSTEEELVTKWGPPDRVYVAPSGRRILTYVRGESVFIPGAQPIVTTTTVGNSVYTTQYGGSPAMVIPVSCTTDITIDDGRISKWHYEGDYCVSE